MSFLLVPFGGLRDIRLEPGETIVISPVTGAYGGAAVLAAITMGVRVITGGRNEEKLAVLKDFVLTGSPNAQIETMAWTGNKANDTATLKRFGTIDAVLDLTSPQASKSLHLGGATSALRRNGRVSMMGFFEQPVVPWTLVGKNISIKGKLMYEREDIMLLIKMLENGLFLRSKAFVDTKVFELEDWAAGFGVAAEHTGVGKQVVFAP